MLALCLILGAAGMAYALPDGVLSMGDFGDAVRELQKALCAAGFSQEEPSGAFTEETRRALMALQEDLNIQPDGVYGPATAEAFEAALSEGRLQIEEAEEEPVLPLASLRIGLDAGHQNREDTELEEMAPNSQRTKARMSQGAVGVKTGISESRINLQIAKKLKAMLEEQGAAVVMTRQSGNVSISNKERALMMNEAEVDFWIRLHCDASTSSRSVGAHALTPSNPCNEAIHADSARLAQHILEQFCRSTGAVKGSVYALSNQTGFNWSERPVVALEMGYLTNAEEDVRLGLDSYQISCAAGICDGILAYIEEQ